MTFRFFCILWLFAFLSPGVQAGVIGGVDTRIGTDTEGRESEFEIDVETGNYIAMIRWNDAASLFFSSDDGTSWFRSIRVSSTQGISSADIAVGSGFIYFAYVTNLTSTIVKIRRFFTDTGLADLTYGDSPGVFSRTLYDAGPDSVTSVALETDVDSTDSEIFSALHLSDGTSRFLRDDSADGTSFIESTLDAANAAGEFDLHWNADFGSNRPLELDTMFLSFVDTSDNIQVWRYDGTWSQSTTFPFSGSQLRAPISALADRIVVAYQAATSNGQAIGYRSSPDGGDSWGPFTVIEAPTTGQGDLSDVDITAKGGLGLAVVYNQDDGAASSTYIRSKPGYEPGPWTDRRSFNDFTTTPGQSISVGWLPSDDYGAIYIGGSSDAAYFDTVTPVGVFLDGFESGDTSLWDGTVAAP